MSTCEQNCDVHLHAEIESLKKALAENQSQLIAMETACLQESDRQVELEDSVIAWQDKYERLYESHKRVQKVNQNLEDKLLKLVDRNSGERAQLTSDVATISVRLAQANYNIQTLQREIDRYKTDMSLAIQLLQCKPDSFIPQKISSLPLEMQSKVTTYMKLDTNSHSDSEGSTSGVGVATTKSYCVLPATESPPPVCPFPPTAMVYSMRGLDAPPTNQLHITNHTLNNNNNNNNEQQSISPAIMAKFLEDELKSSETRHCDTCQCPNKDLTVLADAPKHFSIGSQTIMHGGETNNSLCLRCNSNLNSPSRTNSPYILKLVKSSDSVISETKSSVTDSTQNDKLFTPAKKDDLMVNPILGHHRLCDRSKVMTNRMHLGAIKIAAVPLAQKSVDIKIGADDDDDDEDDVVDLLDEFDDELGKLSKNCNNNNIRRGTLPSADANTSDLSRMRVNEKLTPQSQQGEGAAQPLTHGVGSGSTNSLWSKTSSKEGIKMFESFNRNLIKTIKAENPKMSGPRICKMVLQTGSNNILLDNTTEDVAPVIYTRRERLLDDEVIDNDEDEEVSRREDVSAPPIISASDRGISMVLEKNVTVDALLLHPVLDVSQRPQNKVVLTETSLLTNAVMTSGTMITTVKVEDRKLIDLSEIVQSPKVVANTTKTQSTTTNSISSDAIVDLQESALLRRQQLSRVAEWVQNNSKLNVSERSSNASNSNLVLFDNTSEVSLTKPVATVAPASQSSLIHNKNIQPQLNFNNAPTAHLLPLSSNVNDDQHVSAIRLSASNGEIAQSSNNNQCNSNSQNSDNLGLSRSQQLPHKAQHQSKNSVYEKFNYFHDKTNTVNSDRVFNIQPQSQQPPQHYQQQHPTDLAQMEYNVKQFLLKQNEWSNHNKESPPPSSHKISSSLATSSSNVSVSNTNVKIMNSNSGTVNNQNGRCVHRTETNL